jgi:amino acid transporter
MTIAPVVSASAPGANPDHLLRRELGVRQLAAIIFNYTVGSGIFALPAVVAASLGPAAVLAYIVCAAVMALMVACFAEAGSRISVTGGPYAYVDAAFGSYPGFLAGALYLASDISSTAAVATLFAASVARLTGSSSVLVQDVLAVTVITVVAGVHVRGVRSGARLVEYFTLAKIVPLIAFVALGAFFVRPANLAWSSLPPAQSVVHASGVLIFAFVGIESALVVSGEVRNTSRTVPRAVFLALAAVALLYLAIQTVALGVLGAHTLGQDRVTPLATAMALIAGPTGRVAMLAGATVSTLGYLTGSMLGGPRCVFAFARDGLAPRPLARVHPSYHTPHIAIAVYATVASLLALSGTFESLALITSIASLLVYFGSALSVLRLRARDVRGDGKPFVVPAGPVVPLLACAATAWLLVSTTGRAEAAAMAVTVLIATGLYAVRSVKTPRVLH